MVVRKNKISLFCNNLYLPHIRAVSAAHTVINRLNTRHGMHMAIEHRLDLLELRRQGMERDLCPVTSLLPPFPRLPIDDVFEAVYGWGNSMALMERSYRYMRLYYRFVETKGVSALFRRVPGRLNALSYQSGMCDEVDLRWFDGVLETAVSEAAEFITAADAFRRGEMDREALAGIIGNRKYSGLQQTLL